MDTDLGQDVVVDMFCGAGGTSTGVLEAASQLGVDMSLIAINHWDVAISTHSANHPKMKHYNSDLIYIDPHQAVPSGKLKLLVASPECTHFSRARGGKPMSKQSRASVKYVLAWVNALDVENVIIENVPEFMDWGPLHRKCTCKKSKNIRNHHTPEGYNHEPECQVDKPIKNRKGEYFHRFIAKMRQIGYTVQHRVLNSADYGDPTTRKRLFIIARKGKPVQFPEPSHHKNGGDMFGARPRWKTAREIIDWTIKGESIFNRKKPLADNTLRKIYAGLFKFNGKAFVIGQQSGSAPRDVDQPTPTISGAGAISFVEPTIHEVTDEDSRKVRAEFDSRFVKPFIIQMDQGGRLHDVNNPMPTITSADGFAVVEPYIVEYHSGHKSERRTRSVDEPMPTLDTSNRFGLVQPYLVKMYGTGEPVQSIEAPLPTITTGRNRFYLAEPFIVEYYGTGQSASVDEPMKTITGKDRFGLVEPITFMMDGKKYLLDILFRMFQPHELAAAMSFPKNYKFMGTREQVVKQVGNAVSVNLAKALATSVLSN